PSRAGAGTDASRSRSSEAGTAERSIVEECDASRTPILFVHGIGGYPTEFKYLVGKLDRRRFQPWFAYYPSGLDLDRVADGFARWMQVLQVRCGFRRLVVVAHSMGGLVARAFIERVAGDPAA